MQTNPTGVLTFKSLGKGFITLTNDSCEQAFNLLEFNSSICVLIKSVELVL